ncbi:hypothetical protein S1OALGB6SA_1218 [Olavius algarvensis spirochete endosymbiont]|nr:hypothetical protein S1OALGB6SA_1218 [Olavius algarvensis spirochete endosymbiont]
MPANRLQTRFLSIPYMFSHIDNQDCIVAMTQEHLGIIQRSYIESVCRYTEEPEVKCYLLFKLILQIKRKSRNFDGFSYFELILWIGRLRNPKSIRKYV